MRVTYPIEGTKAEERWKLLSLRHLPARLNAEEAGWLLGFTKEEITILVAKKILKPLGNPSINGRKSFSAADSFIAGEPGYAYVTDDDGTTYRFLMCPFQYDNRNRKVKELRPAASGQPRPTLQRAYDAVGNVTKTIDPSLNPTDNRAHSKYKMAESLKSELGGKSLPSRSAKEQGRLLKNLWITSRIPRTPISRALMKPWVKAKVL